MPALASDAVPSHSADGAFEAWCSALSRRSGLRLARARRGAAQADDSRLASRHAIGTATVRAVIDGRTVQLDGRPRGPAGRHRGAARRRPQGARWKRWCPGATVTLLRLGAGNRPLRPDRGAGRGDGPPHRSNPCSTRCWRRDRPGLSAQHRRYRLRRGPFGAEKAARAAGLGLWADPYYVMRKAEDPAGILAVRGRFAVVEGKVLSVRESGGTIYVNFGRRWSEDFTVTVLKRNERTFTAAGLPLKKLAGQRVRVRGTIEERGGPWIEAARPEQIEIAERLSGMSEARTAGVRPRARRALAPARARRRAVRCRSRACSQREHLPTVDRRCPTAAAGASRACCRRPSSASTCASSRPMAAPIDEPARAGACWRRPSTSSSRPPSGRT